MCANNTITGRAESSDIKRIMTDSYERTEDSKGEVPTVPALPLEETVSGSGPLRIVLKTISPASADPRFVWNPLLKPPFEDVMRRKSLQ